MDRLARDLPLDIVKHFADDIMLVCKDDRRVRALLEERAELLRGLEAEDKPRTESASRGRGRNEEERRREIKKKDEGEGGSAVRMVRETKGGAHLGSTSFNIQERKIATALRDWRQTSAGRKIPIILPPAIAW